MKNERELLPSEQARYNRDKEQKLNRLRRIKRLSAINRLLCLVCACPFFYAASCLGQKKAIPPISAIGGIGFVVCVASAGILNGKEDKATSDLHRLYEQYHGSRTVE